MTTAVLKRTFRKNLDSANFTIVQNPSRDIWCITSSHKLKEFTEYCYVLTTCCFSYAWRFLKHILGIPQEIQNFKTSQKYFTEVHLSSKELAYTSLKYVAASRVWSFAGLKLVIPRNNIFGAIGNV